MADTMMTRTMAAIVVLLSLSRGSSARNIGIRQSGIVDPGVAPNCVSYDIATASGHTCAYFETNWGVSREDFIRWNPSVKADCSGIKNGHYYCVDIETTYPGNDQPSTPTTPSNGVNTPESVQAGIVGNCNAFYRVAKGDTCGAIVGKFGNFTIDDFTKWNSGIGGLACTKLWADAYACIGVIGSNSTAPNGAQTPALPTSTPAPKGCQADHPEPIQPGSICDCKRWYLPVDGEYCFDIERKFQISALQFGAWNPRVGERCENLWKGYYVCVQG